MSVLVDTSVWSLALRRQTRDLNPREAAVTLSLDDLIHKGKAQIVGSVRQEILSGIREESQFLKLRDALRSFRDTPLASEDYEQAAHMSNLCRRHGVAGSAIDFLLCAIASRRHWTIFTTDRDFNRYARLLAIKLYGA